MYIPPAPCIYNITILMLLSVVVGHVTVIDCIIIDCLIRDEGDELYVANSNNRISSCLLCFFYTCDIIEQ